MTDQDLYGQAKSLLQNKYGSLPEAGDTPGSYKSRVDAFRRKQQEYEAKIAQQAAEDAAQEAAKAERERASAIKSVASEDAKNTKTFLEDTYPAAKIEAEKPGRATLMAEKTKLEARLKEAEFTPEQVQIASDLTDGTSGKFAANEAEIARLQTEMAANHPAKGTFWSPTDYERLTKVQEELTSGNRAALSIQRRYLAEAARIAGIPLKAVVDENDRLTAFMSGNLIEPRASVRDIVDGKRDSKAFMAALSANQAMWMASYGNDPVMVYRWASEDPQRSPMPEDVRQRIPNRRMTLMSYSAAPERVLAFTRRLNADAPTLRGQWIASLIAPDQIATWGIMDADASHGPAKEIVALGQSTAASLVSPTVDAKNGNQADLALQTLKEQATARKSELLASLQEASPTRNATSGRSSASDQGTSQAEDTKAARLPSDQSNQLAERRAQAELSTPSADSQGRSNMLHSQAIPASTTSLAAISKANKPVRFDNGAVLVPPTLNSQRAYHGTPHKVERFRLDKIGTGEGAQAYGWGLYSTT